MLIYKSLNALSNKYDKERGDTLCFVNLHKLSNIFDDCKIKIKIVNNIHSTKPKRN